MKKYIVACEPYGCFSPEPLTLDLYNAKDENDLALQLDSSLTEAIEDWSEEENLEKTAIQLLRESNGDGADYYIIKELLPDGTLGPDLMQGD